MDEELRELAALTLLNAFWRDFSSLVNRYEKAAEGLDKDLQVMRMGELTSVYGRDTEANLGAPVSIWTMGTLKNPDIQYHKTIIEALKVESATIVYLQGRLVFERNNGEWYFVGN